MGISGEGEIKIGLGLLGVAAGGARILASSHYSSLGWVLICIAVVGFIALLVHHFAWKEQATLPDMPINEAIDYIVNDSAASVQLRHAPEGYDESTVGKLNWQGEEHQDALRRVREKAVLGQVRVWGSLQIGPPSAKRFDDVPHEIPAEYWKGADFNSLFCFHKTADPQTIPFGGAEGVPLYNRVTLSGAQMRKIWPRIPLWRRAMGAGRRKERLSYRASPPPLKGLPAASPPSPARPGSPPER